MIRGHVPETMMRSNPDCMFPKPYEILMKFLRKP